MATAKISPPLDAALAQAMDDADKVEHFYNLLLSEELLLPVWELPATGEGVSETTEDTSINPIIVDDDGDLTLMLFDTEDRLAEWAQEEVAFVGLEGNLIFSVFDSDLRIVLNPGQELTKTFEPDEVKWLHDVVTGNPPVQNREGDTDARIGLPAELPGGLETSLKAEIPKWPKDIQVAYIFGMEPDLTKVEYVVVVGLVRKPGGVTDDQEILQALGKKLGETVTPGPHPIDIQFLEQGSPELDIVMELTGPTISN